MEVLSVMCRFDASAGERLMCMSRWWANSMIVSQVFAPLVRKKGRVLLQTKVPQWFEDSSIWRAEMSAGAAAREPNAHFSNIARLQCFLRGFGSTSNLLSQLQTTRNPTCSPGSGFLTCLIVQPAADATVSAPTVGNSLIVLSDNKSWPDCWLQWHQAWAGQGSPMMQFDILETRFWIPEVVWANILSCWRGNICFRDKTTNFRVDSFNFCLLSIYFCTRVSEAHLCINHCCVVRWRECGEMTTFSVFKKSDIITQMDVSLWKFDPKLPSVRLWHEAQMTTKEQDDF